MIDEWIKYWLYQLTKEVTTITKLFVSIQSVKKATIVPRKNRQTSHSSNGIGIKPTFTGWPAYFLQKIQDFFKGFFKHIFSFFKEIQPRNQRIIQRFRHFIACSLNCVKNRHAQKVNAKYLQHIYRSFDKDGCRVTNK